MKDKVNNIKLKVHVTTQRRPSHAQDDGQEASPDPGEDQAEDIDEELDLDIEAQKRITRANVQIIDLDEGITKFKNDDTEDLQDRPKVRVDKNGFIQL